MNSLITPKSKVAAAVLMALSITGCEMERSGNADSYVMPTTGFVTSSTTVTEEGAGTLFIRVNVDLPSDYKETYLAKGKKEADFSMAAAVTAETSSTATEDTDYRIGTIFFSGSLDTPYFLVPVTILNDEDAEDLEVLKLSITSADANPSSERFNSHIITITDSDLPRTLSFSETSIVAREGNIVDLGLTLSQPSNTPLSIPISISGTAKLGADFNLEAPVYLKSGQPYNVSYTFDNTTLELVVKIPANVTSLTVPLSVVSDGLGERSEYIQVTISDNESGYDHTKNGVSRVSIIGNYSTNDTGVTKYSDGSVFQSLVTSPLDYPNQDAGVGAVTDASSNNGFTLVYRDVDGEIASSTNLNDGDQVRCTEDAVTGLLWLNHAPSLDANNNSVSDTLEQSITYTDATTGLPQSTTVSGHYLPPSDLASTKSNRLYSDLMYYYDDNDSSRNGGVKGLSSLSLLYTQAAVTAISSAASVQSLATSNQCLPLYTENNTTSSSNCFSSTLMTYLNSVNMCGRSNWRLPTYHELYSTVDFSQSSNAFGKFSNIAEGSKVLTRTTTPNANGSVLCLNTSGETRACNKIVPASIIPVSDDL